MFGPHALTAERLFYAGVLIVVSVAATFAVALTVLVRLPSDYFSAARAQDNADGRRGILVFVVNILRNLFGAALVALGIILSVPGVPGQGLLTIVAGLLLLDFPGKRRLLSKLVCRPPLLRMINHARAKCSRAPLIIADPNVVIR